MADRTVRFILTGDSAGAIKAMADTSAASDATGDALSGAGSKADEAGGKFKQLAESLGVPSALLNGWAALGLAAVGVGVAAVKMGQDMQAADTSIAVASGQTVKSATDIGNALLNTAGSSEFTGREMATAFATVAGQLKATEGQTLSTKQAMDVMSASQDLATAKQISLGDSTTDLANAMQAFQIPASGAAGAANVLFNASNDTGQSVDSVTSSLDKLKSKLGDTSPPMSALASLMVDMTNHGITGRAALTGVNTAMTGLVAAAGDTTTAGKAADDELKSFGISATTASGQLTPMSDIIDALGPKFDTMTQAQQLSTATTIFGASAAKDMVSVIDAGPAAFDAATDSVTKMGAAHTAAATQAQTLSVEIKTIEATVEDWMTELGEKLIPVLGEVVQWIGLELPKAIDVGKTAFEVVKPVLEGMVDEVKGILTVLQGLITFVKGVFSGDWSEAWKGIESIFGGVLESIKGALLDEFGVLLGLFDTFGSKVGDFFLDLGKSIVSAIVNGIKSAAGDIGSALEAAVKSGVGGIPVIGGALSHIPGLATGGIVNQPTLAVIGENEPEAVIPLSMIPGGMGSMSGGTPGALPAGGIASAGQVGHNITINAPNANPQSIGTEVSWALKIAS